MNLLWLGKSVDGIWHLPSLLEKIQEAREDAHLMVCSDFLTEYEANCWGHNFYGEALHKTYRALIGNPSVDFFDMEAIGDIGIEALAKSADGLLYPFDPLTMRFKPMTSRLASLKLKKFMTVDKDLAEAMPKEVYFDYPVDYDAWAGEVCMRLKNVNHSTKQQLPLLIAPVIYPVGRDGYSGVEKLVGLFARALDRCLVTALEDSTLPTRAKLTSVGPQPQDYEEKAVSGVLASLYGEYDVAVDFSHAKHLGRSNPNANQISIIWHDPYTIQPPQPIHNVIALSLWQASRFKKRYKQDCYVLNPICADADYFSQSGGVRDDRLIFIGKMHPSKGALEAIELCKRLKQKLWLIGPVTPGDPPSYVKEVIASCDQQDIMYLGEVSEAEKLMFLQKAKALFYPVSYPPGQGESHSHKLVEAMLCGTPCIVNDQGAMGEVVDDGVTGKIYKREAELVDAVESCRDMDNTAVRDAAIKRWDYREVVAKWEFLMHSVSAGEKW